MVVVHYGHVLSRDHLRHVSELLGLAGFAFVSSVTPGPNNALLWASGLRFGFRGTARHVAGTAAGMAMLVLVAAAGVGVVFLAVPGAHLALKAVGTAYLVYLAFRIAGSRGANQAAVSRPLGIVHGAAFQFANPKAWLFALAAVGTFHPPGLTPAAAAAATAAISAAVILGTAAIWAAAGTALRRITENDRARRAVNLTLALLLAVSVVFIWI